MARPRRTRSLLSFSWRRPVRRAASVRVPFLLVVPEADSIAPVPAALEVARKAPGAELFRSAGGHYDVYEGGASFADVLRTEVDFLHRPLSVQSRDLRGDAGQRARRADSGRSLDDDGAAGFGPKRKFDLTPLGAGRDQQQG